MDSNTCLLDIIDDPNALSEFFAQGPENGQVPVGDNADLDDLHPTLWDDDPTFAPDISIDALASTAALNIPAALPQTVQAPAAAVTSVAQQIVATHTAPNPVALDAAPAVPFQSTAAVPLVQQSSAQVVAQPSAAMVSGTSASPLMQLSTSGSVASAMQPQQQQVFLQSAASAGQIQLRAAAAPAQQAALQVPTAASSPAPSNVINLQQVIRPVVSTGTSVQIRPQQILQTSAAQAGQVNLQGAILQAGNRILIQQPVISGQPLTLANLQGLQLRPQVQGAQIVQGGQVFQAAPANQTVSQPAQLVQAAPTVQQGQVLQTTHGATAQVVQQAQLLQANQQAGQVLQSNQGAQVLQQTQQGQIVQQAVVNPSTLQSQPQTQQIIQLAGNQLPTGISVLHVDGQQILIQKAPTAEGPVILRAVQNTIPIQTAAQGAVSQVGGAVRGSQQQVLITQPGGQIQQSQMQLPQNQMQPQVLGNLNILNDSQNVNINLNFLTQGQQGSASQALQQIQQNKLQMSGGQIVQTNQGHQGANPTTPVKILPKSPAAGGLQCVSLQSVQQQVVKPLVASGAAATGFQAGTVSQQPVIPSGQDILSTAAALNDIPLQMQTPPSQPVQSKPVINTASSVPSMTVMSSAVAATSQAPLQAIKVEPKPLIQTIAIDQKPQIQTVKTEPVKSVVAPPQHIRTPQGQITVMKQEPAQAAQAATTLSQQHVTLQSSQGSAVSVASQGLQQVQTLAAGTTAAQAGIVHHQPVQGKSSDTSATTNGPQNTQASVVTQVQQASSTVIQQQQPTQGSPVPNVNIATMRHLQTLPANADLLVKSSAPTTVIPTVVPSVANATNSAVPLTQPATAAVVAPGPQTQQTTGQAPTQGMDVRSLLPRIQHQIKVLLAIPNRNETQKKMLKNLGGLQKRFTAQLAAIREKTSSTPMTSSGGASKGAQTRQSTTGAVDQTPNPIVIQPLLQPGEESQQVGVPATATTQSTNNALQGMFVNASGNNVQKVSAVMTQPTNVTVTQGASSAKPAGLIQIRPVVATQSVQNVITVPASGVAAAAGAAPGAAVAAANAPGQVLVTAQSVHQPGKVTQIQLPAGLKERLEQQLMKLPPHQQELFKKNQPKVMLRLHQQLVQQQRGGPVSGITKIPITINAVTTTSATVLQSVTTSMQPVVVASDAAGQQFFIKRPTRSQRIAQQLARDQKAATQPDCRSPFKQYKDACQKLLRFHVFQDDKPNYKQMLLEGDAFEERASELVERKERMFNKFELLTYKEAMRERVTSESVMLEKLFLQEESKILREEKHLAMTEPDLFMPRPSKRTAPSPDAQAEEAKADFSDPSEPKLPKYGPTPSAEEVPIKQEVPDVKTEPPVCAAQDAYTAHSSGGLKMVFKSSPAHVPSSYAPSDVSYAAPNSEPGDLVKVELDVDEVEDETPAPFQSYESDEDDRATDEEFQTQHSTDTESQTPNSPAEARTTSTPFDVSEDDAAVAGLLSDFRPVSESDEVQVIEPDFDMTDSRVVSQAYDSVEQSFEDSQDVVARDQREVDTAVHGLMDDMGFSSTDSADFTSALSQEPHASDYDSLTREAEVDQHSYTGHNVASADSFGGLNQLNTEMESAINSILSLNDSGEGNDFDDVNDFYG